MRVIILTLITLMAFSSALLGSEKPNIVLIFADDFGLSDIDRIHQQTRGVPGGAPTPNIEALIDEGMWFTDAHSPTALCAPSRYALMTGNYNIRSSSPGGIWEMFQENTITNSDVTIGQAVKREGYHTGFIGKWHFGGDFYRLNTTTFFRGNPPNAVGQVDFNNWISNNPFDLGFNYDFTLPDGVQGPAYLAYENSQWYPLGANSTIIKLTDNNFDPFQLSAKGEGPGDTNWNAYEMNEIMANKAVNFINNASQQADPFFLYYSATSVHVPHAPADYIEGIPFAGTTPHKHTDMIKVFDWEVKKIVDALKANGEYDNTVLVFTSDNGGLNYSTDEGHFSSGILRGDKRDPFEGGHRIPLIVVWPGVVSAGSTSDYMINGTDLVATFTAIAGGCITANEAKDSHNFLQILLEDNNYQPRTELINQGASGPRTATIRDGDWKLIFECNANLDGDFNPTHLFDLNLNISENESGNRINDPSYQTRKNDMLNRFIQLRNSSARSVPLNCVSYDPGNVIIQDTDNDGVPDSQDNCPNFNNNLIGTQCDDGDPCTTNDVFTTNCVCAGTSISVTSVSLLATEDAYVRGGSYANSNFGAGGLLIKNTANDEFNRTSYIKFDLSNQTANNFMSGSLQLHVLSNSVNNLAQSLSLVSDDSWTESGITWNNQPAAASAITNFNIPTSGQKITVDISAVVFAVLNSDKILTLKLEGTNTTYITYSSREGSNINAPQLLLNFDACGSCPDSDNDNICDADDNTNGNCILNGSCNDGDDCTTDEAYDANCNCFGGVFQDADNDSVCDANDICPAGDDNMDLNMDGVPDDCYVCLNTIVDINNPNILYDREATISISTNGKVLNGVDVEYHAGQIVELLNEFEVELGAEFEVYIASCD